MASAFQHLKWRLEVLAYDVLKLLISPFSLDQISWASGKLIGWIGPKTSKHHIAKTGMKIAFPDASDEQINAWLKESWNRMGRTFGEFPLLGRIHVFDDPDRFEIVGFEKLEKLKQDGQAAVLISGHFANWELIAASLSQMDIPIRLTYRPANNPYFDQRIRRERKAYGSKLMVPKSGPKGAKELMMALRDGFSVGLMNDQKFNEGIAVPFFGVDAMTAPGPTRLALQSKAPLIPMSLVRTEGAKFRITVHDPIKLERTGDRHADIRSGVLKVNAFMEDHIRAHPTDWFWVHRRWPKEIYRER